ncbi:hypothetical protein Slin15195_G057310 [Septoria linicola]|uniref:MARVEL domain-containing protein n=1 Tax=Septoria linicola TaxID=215465 RepID=A0A9Q9EJP7_9PEZI|nr:hypothetical protein Slin14017_G073180 [Septoria linicola]USW52412.1 hypothetical protein Slin15195_G057310 [Septoria linicola]
MPTQPKPRAPIVRYFANWYQNTSQDLGFRLAIRILQFALALTSMVIYSRDLRAFTAANVHAPASWIYAEVVAALSIIVCAWCVFKNVHHRVLRLMLDFVIAVLWSAQAGYFGIVYWQDDGRGNESRPPQANEKRMKDAVAVALVCVGLWMVSWFQSVVWRCQALKQRLRNRRARKEAQRQRQGMGEQDASRESSEPALKRDERAIDGFEDVELAIKPIEEPKEEDTPAEAWVDEKSHQNDFVAHMDGSDIWAGETVRAETENPPPAYSK